MTPWELAATSEHSQSRNALRHARINNGLCRDCGKVPFAENKVICLPCFGRRKDQRAIRIPRMKAERKCIRCAEPNERNSTLCQSCMDKQVHSMRVRRKENKEFVFAYFGGKCVDCGEIDIRCLSLDHKENNGAQDCAGPKGRIAPMTWYARLKRLIDAGKSITDLQILCFNYHARKDLIPWWNK